MDRSICVRSFSQLVPEKNQLEMIHLLMHIVLFVMPTGIEAFDDRAGDSHTSNKDVFIRGAFIIIGAMLVATVYGYNVDGYFKSDVFLEYLVKAALMSFLYFSGAFQYLVNITQRKITEQDWRKHLNTKTIPDRWHWYRNMDWRLRMVGHGLLIVIGWIYYFV
jgi:hypothetical protein